MYSSIILKLKPFLDKKHAFSNERDIVYIMVELRKLIDIYDEIKNIQRKNEKEHFKFIRFYCDWVVHPKKTKNINIIEKIINNIIKENSEEKTKKESVKMIYSEKLRESLKNLLSDIYGMSYYEITEDDNLWLSFVYHLSNVLEEQPIIISDLEKFKITIKNKENKGSFYKETIFLWLDGKKIESPFIVGYNNF